MRGWPLATLLVAIFAATAQSYAVPSITSTSGNIVYVDSSSNVSPNLLGNYVSFNVTNTTGSTIADAWVTIGSFTGSYVSLAPNETGVAHLGTMAAGATKAAFFYLQANCSSFSAGQCNVSTAQPFTVALYSGRPSSNLVTSQAFSVTVQETIAAQSNTVSTVVTSSNDPDLGTLLMVTVTGSTGTIGSAKVFYETPEAYVDFPADVFKLYSTSVTFSGGNTGTYTNQLLIPPSAFTSTSSTAYSFVATYIVVGMKANTTAVSPVAFISSGNQIKHTDTSGYSSLPPIAPTDNTLTLSKLVDSAIWPTGGTPTYTLRISNAGSSSVTVDDFVDSLPTSPGTVSYVSASSSFAGSAIGDPSISGSTLTWSGTFTVPANGSADLTFQAAVPNLVGTYTNSAVAHIGTTQLDTTITTTDNSPATASLSVGSPDLTISKTHSGNFTQGQTGATYSVTANNAGSGPTVGTVTVTDTLPSGLTATAINGSGWSCTLGTLTCTRSDALAASSSYPIITLTVNVASNAPASLTNTAAVSGGGESNTSNDSASDVTTVTQLPDLTITKTHSGSFTQGQTGAAYSITASNSGTGATSSTVTVTDTLPSGLTATAISGSGWSCTLGTLTCTRSDALAASSSYPIITLTVNVAGNAPASLTNTAAVSGGGESNTSNDSASDVTIINAQAQSATTTTLAISPGNLVDAGATITLTATVLHGSTPVFPGLVTLCDANATQCSGTAIFGTAQLGNSGTATLKLVLGAGSYSIKAVFAGTSLYQNSESSPQSLTVTGVGGYPSTTTISASGSANNYTLTGTVAAFGKPVPTGTVSFLDTTTGNSVLAAVALDPNSLGFTMAPATDSPAVDGSPYFATTGDFNNDGKIDLAVPNGSTSTVGILLGNGDGTFQSQVTYGTDPNGDAYAIAVGDFNADGNPDLVVTNTGNGIPTISILLGNGDGTFQPQVTYTVGHYPSAVVVGDFNGDGDVDLAITNRDDNTISILLGNGDGTFQPQMTYAVGNAPVALAAIDLNGDGCVDLIAANRGDNTLGVLLGNCDGTFQPQAIYAVGNAPVSLAAADFDGDGSIDLAATNSNDNTVSVLLGKGDGTFQPQTTEAVQGSPGPLAAADFNGDGKVDLASPNATADTLNILLGNGDGTFQTTVTFPAGTGPTALAVGDFNGDGLTDLATTGNAAPSLVSVLLSEHTETATATGVSVSTPGTHDVLASYPGDDNHGASQSTTIPLTGPALTATTTVLTASPNPASAGQPVTFTATVSPTPTGTVTFYNGATLVGTATVNSSGIATLTISNLALGSNLISAVYSGNTNFATSTSSTLTETINGNGLTPTATVLIASPNPAVVGQSVTFTATVNPTPTGSPTGTVSFYNGSTLLGTATVNSFGVATLTTSALAVGTNLVSAAYSGNASFATSTSSPLTETITKTPTTTALAVSPDPVVVGQSVTFTATVAPIPTGAPIGTISFYNGTSLLGSATVNSSGVATFTNSGLMAGTDTIIAVYSGNANFASSTSTPVTITVGSAAAYSVTAPQTRFTATAGGSVKVNVFLPPVGGAYNKLVTMSASGLPAGAVASFTPPTVTPGNAGAPTVMTIQTSVQTANIPENSNRQFPFALMTFAVGVCFFASSGKRRGKFAAILLLMVSCAGGTLTMTGCGGGFAGKPIQSHTYVVTITGTSETLHPSTTITLIVQ
ncbi:MAG TPA: Ig-like domain repeat protein [Candidatus Sulfotelmatobacter sp.]|nr:Ig-like domain repeat protein [Candidatus Sulfotelmatobacter sp.]